jgi:hypothetical protein
MADRLLTHAWWIAIMSLIAITAIASLLLAYRGVYELLSASWRAGAFDLCCAIPMGAGAILLCCHRGDLVCD